MAAGRDILGDFAPKLAELNDNVLSGQVWVREERPSPRDRDVVTVTALMASGVPDTSLRAYIKITRSNGITRDEMVEILTHAALYAEWPKVWAAFHYTKEIYTE